MTRLYRSPWGARSRMLQATPVKKANEKKKKTYIEGSTRKTRILWATALRAHARFVSYTLLCFCCFMSRFCFFWFPFFLLCCFHVFVGAFTAKEGLGAHSYKFRRSQYLVQCTRTHRWSVISIALSVFPLTVSFINLLASSFYIY